MDLSNQVVLVTGGQRGIGRGISQAFVDAGATVVTCARSPVEAPLAGTRHFQCDVRDPASVEALIDGIVDEYRRLDVVVNNAGGAPSVSAAEASPSFHDKIFGLNLSAPLLVAQIANRVMQGQTFGGSIVNITSLAANRPAPTIAAYAAAKAGLESLTRSLAMEWGPKVRVNAIEVGLCRTEQTDDHYGGDDRVAKIEATIPLGRMARPQEVGNVAVFLSSDLASYVSGASVGCHGGGEPPIFLHID